MHSKRARLPARDQSVTLRPTWDELSPASRRMARTLARCNVVQPHHRHVLITMLDLFTHAGIVMIHKILD